MDKDYGRDSHPGYLRRKAQWQGNPTPTDVTGTKVDNVDKRPTKEVELSFDKNSDIEVGSRMKSLVADTKSWHSNPDTTRKYNEIMKNEHERMKVAGKKAAKDSTELEVRKKRSKFPGFRESSEERQNREYDESGPHYDESPPSKPKKKRK